MPATRAAGAPGRVSRERTPLPFLPSRDSLIRPSPLGKAPRAAPGVGPRPTALAWVPLLAGLAVLLFGFAGFMGPPSRPSAASSRTRGSTSPASSSAASSCSSACASGR